MGVGGYVCVCGGWGGGGWIHVCMLCICLFVLVELSLDSIIYFRTFAEFINNTFPQEGHQI